MGEPSDIAVALITGLEVIVDRASEVLSTKDVDPILRGQVAHIRTVGARLLQIAAGLAPAPSAQDVEAIDPLSQETVLLVDDEPSVRTLLADTLRRNGFAVIAASNGEDAIERASKLASPISVVVTDVVMPEMSGRELVQLLRGWYPSLRVVFMSGYTDAASMARMLEDESTAFVPKPFTTADLIRAIQGLLEAD
jgi:two-component system cell cycle sensor histidine kinase/response regulator CckA